MLPEIGSAEFFVEFKWHRTEAAAEFIRVNRLPIIAFLHVEIAFGEGASHLFRCFRDRDAHPSELTYLRATSALESDKAKRYCNEGAPQQEIGARARYPPFGEVGTWTQQECEDIWPRRFRRCFIPYRAVPNRRCARGQHRQRNRLSDDAGCA